MFKQGLLSEEDTKRIYITPAIESKWDQSLIKMECKITDGEMTIEGKRKKALYADYVLFTKDYSHPIAVVEAKSNSHKLSDGIQQAIDYAIKLDVKFAYSSNGTGFIERDFITGSEKEISLDNFPSEEELVERFKSGLNITDIQEKLMKQDYYHSQKTYEPRYYQRNAIDRILDAIANNKTRLLIQLATGTGKTYIAFQSVYRLLKSGMVKKVLYLADRNVLVDQSISQDFQPLEKECHKIDYTRDDPTTISSYNIYFSLYQQLSGNSSYENDHYIEERIKKFFDKDFFDLVIVDECHRGSARANSYWRRILEYFSSAIQLGMTATPKETSEVSNIDYFGEPIYTYTLNGGIKDGYLAPFKVYNIMMNISEGWRPYKDQVDLFGNIIEDRIYNNKDYDYNIVLLDRIEEVAYKITEYLKATDRMQKTIVFTPTEEAADRMRIELINMNQDIVREHPDYIVRITGSDQVGRNMIKPFSSISEAFPTIAVTSELLSTGVDTKMVKLIVIDKNIESMIEFKQIIGRGTRLKEEEGKTHFTIMDFRNVSRKFADEDWDGPVEIVDDYDPNKARSNGGDHSPTIPTIKPYIDQDGCEVRVVMETVSIYDAGGKLLSTQNIIDYTKTTIQGEYASLENFISKWSNEEKKIKIKELFEDKGINIDTLKKEKNMEDVDDFDFICHLGFDKAPLTRKQRVKFVEESGYLDQYTGVARQVLDVLLDKYADFGIYEIEDLHQLTLDPLNKIGNPKALIESFGNRDAYFKTIKELERELYK